MTAPKILALNCGSSSLKFGVYSSGDLLFEGEAEEIGGDASFWTRAGQEKHEAKQQIKDHSAAFDLAVHAIKEAGVSDLAAVGHRVVHGGPKLRNHVRLDDGVLTKLRAATDFAPLHLPASLAVINAVSTTMQDLPQVICLDTAFHKNLPDLAKTLPFSKAVRDQGIERYGFHGLSLESILEEFKIIPARLVIAHLGNGSSITAILKGQSIDTTMGLTPTGGILMGTRSGDVDPGVMIYLLRHGMNAEKLETLVDHDSGLKGISERSSDVRELTDARASDAHCDLALRMFAYQVKKAIAAMTAALGGVDLLVFTGGIGEHASELRDEVNGGLSYMGNFETRVLPAQEDLQIARITQRLALESQTT